MSSSRQGTARSILVVALGNPMAGDDGFGQAVASRLRDLDVPALQVVDLSREGPTGLLDHLENPSALLVIDAVNAPGMKPGERVDVDWAWEGRPALVHEPALSTHGLSVAHQLELAASLGMVPGEVRLIGAVLESARCGDGISASLSPTVSWAVERILHWKERWRLEVRTSAASSNLDAY